MRRNAVIYLFLFFAAQNIYAQNKVTKTVVSFSEKTPLPFVSITLVNNPVKGTLTNEDGLFVLHVSYSWDTLEISHIGYEKIKIPVSFNKDTLYLKKSLTELEEVVVTDISAEEVIKRVIDSLETNHAVEPVTYQAFVRITVYPADSSALDLFEEHLVALHQTKNNNSKFKIIKTRVSAFTQAGKKRLKDLRLINMVSIYTDNLFRYQADFLKTNKMKYFSYSFSNEDKYDGEEFYVIECKSREAQKDLRAQLFIDKASLAICRIIKFYSAPDTFTEVNFKNYNGKWYLANSWKHFKSSQDKTNAEVSFTDRVCFYTFTEEFTDFKEFKSTINIIAEPVREYAEDFNDDFWGNIDYLPIPVWIKRNMK